MSEERAADLTARYTGIGCGLGCLLLFLPLLVIWAANYAVERSGKCMKLGRALTDREFVEAVLTSDDLRSYIGANEWRSIKSKLLAPCCQVRRDQSDLYWFDRATLGTYIIDVNIRYYSESEYRSFKASKPYRSIDAELSRCAGSGDLFVSSFSDPF